MERTLVIIKPDGIEKRITGEVIKRIEQAGLELVAIKTVYPTLEIMKKHYPDELGEAIAYKAAQSGMEVHDHKKYGEMVLNWLRNYFINKKIFVMVFQGQDAVKKVRDIIGPTDPAAAPKGTIRGDFGDDSILKANLEGRPVRNLVHASSSKEDAEREIEIWFPELK